MFEPDPPEVIVRANRVYRLILFVAALIGFGLVLRAVLQGDAGGVGLWAVFALFMLILSAVSNRRIRRYSGAERDGGPHRRNAAPR